MWPWEHLTVGYLFYSGYARLVHGEKPGNEDVIVLAFATQLPDVIDKPLAWWLGVLPSGLSLAHSLLFAVPLCLLVVALERRTDSAAVGPAFSIGYLSHLAGDVVYPFVTTGSVRLRFLLWPLVPSSPVAPAGFLSQILGFLDDFTLFLGTPRGQFYLLVEILLLAIGFGVWVADRFPGPGIFRREPGA